MEDSPQLRVQKFEELPSATAFASQIESRNLPAVFSGCIKDWKAFTRWNPANGGLDYLQERVGSCLVEAMMSRTAPVFYGDIRSHERVPLPFSTFIDFCKQRLQCSDDRGGAAFDSERDELTDFGAEPDAFLSGTAPQQIYLAQVPIMNAEDQERVQLEALGEDIKMPRTLDAKELASVNLWMNNAQSRTSTHYDPHHNLLCIVAGRKQVVLWPPSASPLLYPMPLYGEASNHSAVGLENPDFSLYPRAKCSMEYSQKVVLHAGDALFIPEGWFHQVDSDDLTIAVNFWWRSNIMSSMLEHMDSYYLRRILRRLVDNEMNRLLPKAAFPVMERQNRRVSELPSCGETGHAHSAHERRDLLGNNQQGILRLHELEPRALQALHELVFLVHNHVKINDQDSSLQSTSTNDHTVCMKDAYNQIATSNLYLLKSDPIAKILWTLDASTLQNVLLAMAHNFRRTLEALILHLLSPVGAEVLTRKFDEMDQQTSEETRNKFYKAFYGAFDDQFAAMDAILKGKESFASQAFKDVLDQYLGVNSDLLKPSLG